MSDDADRRRNRARHYGAVRTSISEPEDRQQGQWPRDKLEDMDARFVAKMEWAFQWGHERRASAANAVELPTSPTPRFSAPLCPEVWAGLLRTSA
jgi:hypothetical protein